MVRGVGKGADRFGDRGLEGFKLGIGESLSAISVAHDAVIFYV